MKVRILHSHYSEIKVGEIKEATFTGENYFITISPDSFKWCFYPSEIEILKGNKMKVGDTIRITDGSFSRRICKDGLEHYWGAEFKEELWRVLSLDVSLPVKGVLNDTETLNVLVRGEDSGIIAFVLDSLCRPYHPEQDIEVKYFRDGEDVTDKISNETKRNLAQ